LDAFGDDLVLLRIVVAAATGDEEGFKGLRRVDGYQGAEGSEEEGAEHGKREQKAHKKRGFYQKSINLGESQPGARPSESAAHR
jgi:hypothetical protein